MVFARPGDRETRPSHFSFRPFHCSQAISRAPDGMLDSAADLNVASNVDPCMRHAGSFHSNLISMACFLLCSSAARVRVSHAYRKYGHDKTAARISLILFPKALLLPFQISRFQSCQRRCCCLRNCGDDHLSDETDLLVVKKRDKVLSHTLPLAVWKGPRQLMFTGGRADGRTFP